MLFLKERIIILCQDILFTGFGPGDNSIKPFECINYICVSTAKKNYFKFPHKLGKQRLFGGKLWRKKMYEIVSSRGLIQSDVLTCSLHKRFQILRFQILRFQFLFASHRLIVPVEILNGESIL